MTGGRLERFAYTERARLAILFARRAARERRADAVDCPHLVFGLLREEEGTAAAVLECHGVTLEHVLELLGHPDPAAPGSEAAAAPFTPSAERVLERAAHEARWAGRDYAATEHLLLGLVHEAEGDTRRLLLAAGVAEDGVRAELAARRR